MLHSVVHISLAVSRYMVASEFGWLCKGQTVDGLRIAENLRISVVWISAVVSIASIANELLDVVPAQLLGNIVTLLSGIAAFVAYPVSQFLGIEQDASIFR